jgi:hypothetical protein
MRYALSMSLALALCAGAAISLAAPAMTPAAETYKAPRNSWGQPDLGGNWSNASLSPLTREAGFGSRATYTDAEVKEREGIQKANVEDSNKPIDNTKPLTDGVIDAHGGVGAVGNQDRQFLDPGSVVMRVHGQARNSLLTTPDGQVPARKKGAPPAPARERTKIAADRSLGMFDDPEQLPISVQCVMYGTHAPLFPNGIYNQNYQFVQTKNEVALHMEMIHDTRVVRLNGTHRTDGVRPYMGDSVGHYEGDTLVVETTNLPEKEALFGSWQNLKLTERFTRVAKDRVLYQFTIDDPTLWDKPWGGEYEFSALKGRLMEYACTEGNYGMEGILAGARQQDAAEAAAAKKPVATR